MNTLRFTEETFFSYVRGWGPADGDTFSLDEMESMLHNSLAMLRDPQDGIEFYAERIEDRKNKNMKGDTTTNVIGKTIKDVDTSCSNVIHITFTDDTKISISGEVGCFGIPYILIENGWKFN